jgi:large subunit ribosomal protein L16
MRPRRTKFKKYHKPSISNGYKKKSHLIYGDYGLLALEGGLIKDSQIMCSIMCMKRKLKRKGKISVRIFPHIGVSKKPLEVRMGKGKGSVDHYATEVKGGSVMFELVGASESIAKTALKIAASKLPIKCRILIK